MKTRLSKKEAARLALQSQGLLKKNPFGKGKGGVLRTLDQLGYIQIDTISVIQRTHNHTFWTRVQNFNPDVLDELQVKDRKIFEYWSHAAAYLPLADYRFYLYKMHAIAAGEKHWHVPDKKMMKRVLNRFMGEGPLMARDFKPPEDHQAAPWWNWKPAKRALEQLFIEGKLMIVRRNNFHKVYDLPERVLPANLDTTLPTTEEYCRFLILRAIRAHGLATEGEIGYLRKGIKKDVKTTLQQMLENGDIQTVNIAGIANQLYYTTEESLSQLANLRVSKNIHLLSPFDNCVIQRKRVQQIFGFNYQLECYVPAQKRVYGYFCLPILWGDRFIGRLDPKADRQSKTFFIRNLCFEPTFKDFEQVLQPLAGKIKDLASFNNCHSIVIEKTEPKPITSQLRTLIGRKV